MNTNTKNDLLGVLLDFVSALLIVGLIAAFIAFTPEQSSAINDIDFTEEAN